jgi:adenine-specific DNA methylase
VKKTISKVVEDCAVALQKVVRMKAAIAENLDGYVTCVSCGVKKHWKELDAGHYFSRGDKSVKLMEENIHPQCKGCNIKMSHGDTKVVTAYRRHMVDMYGEDFLDHLEALAWTPTKFNRAEIEALTKTLKAQIKEYESQL